MLIDNMGDLIHTIGFLFAKFIISTQYVPIQLHLEFQLYKSVLRNCIVCLYQCTVLYELGDSVEIHHAAIMTLAQN